MRIIRIVSELDFGGVEKRIELTAKGFLNYPKDELIFIVLHQGGVAAEYVHKLGFTVIILNLSPRIPNLFLIIKLYKLFKEIQPEVIHCSGAESNFHGLWAACVAKVPVRIGEEIGYPNHDWKWRSIFKITYLSASKIIAISEAVKFKIIEIGEVNSKQVEVVYNPFLGDTLSLKNVERGAKINEAILPFIFVTTCRLESIKNLSTLIEVFQKLVSINPKISLELWIIGEGSEREQLQNKIKDLGLIDKVKLLGYNKDIFQFLDKADAFILPSYSEGFSISLVEAMSSGLPCIATKNGGPAEIVKDDTGFLIDPYNPDDIICKMQVVLEMPFQARKEFGQRAIEDVIKRFSIEKYVNNLRTLYASL